MTERPGAVVGPHGRLQLTAHLPEDRTLQGFPYPEFGTLGVALTETSLLDARHAEVHLVIRSHGPKMPGLVDRDHRPARDRRAHHRTRHARRPHTP